MTGQKPLYTCQVAGISAAIWENNVSVNGRTVPIQKATVQRRYKNKAGEWQNTNSFGRNELPLAIFCMQKVFEKMLGEGNANSDNIEEEVIM